MSSSIFSTLLQSKDSQAVEDYLQKLDDAYSEKISESKCCHEEELTLEFGSSEEILRVSEVAEKYFALQRVYNRLVPDESMRKKFSNLSQLKEPYIVPVNIGPLVQLALMFFTIWVIGSLIPYRRV